MITKAMVPNLIVKTCSGLLRGKESLSTRKKPFRSFLGIPYAQPPARFSPARPLVGDWTGVREATEYGSDAAQYDLVSKSITGSEDCLYLNVFTRFLDNKVKDVDRAESESLPVMVWIHGGGFFSGSGSDRQYGPEKAMNEEIVLVTLNYRLGPLGFMSTSDGVMPGNLGLKDQLLALTWIKENIAAFGGDQSNITLFGESAGAASTHYHMLSRKSRGLFHKVILQSGSALCSWTQNHDPDGSVKNMAEALKCKGKTSAELKAELRKLPWADIVRAGTKLNKMPHLTTFLPVVEKSGKDRFLEQDPEITMSSAHVLPKMPMLIGYTANEMAPWAATLLQVRRLAPKLNDPEFITDMFRLKHYNQDDQTLVSRVRNQYFGQKPISRETLYNLIDGLNDEMMFHPIWRTIELFMRSKHDQVYMFKYSHEGEYGWANILGMEDDPKLRAAHFDEVILQFTNKVWPAPENDEPDDRMAMEIWRLWAQFAKHGNPSSDWKPCSLEKPVYFDLKIPTKLKKHLPDDNIRFWDSCLKKTKTGQNSKL